MFFGQSHSFWSKNNTSLEDTGSMWVWEDIFPELQKTQADNSVYLQKKILSDPYFMTVMMRHSAHFWLMHIWNPQPQALWLYYYSYS